MVCACERLVNAGINAIAWFPWGLLIILCLLLLTGCGSYWCDKNLDANVASGNAMAYTIWHECNERNAARADAFQGGMNGVSRSFSEKSNIYSDQLPRNYNIHY